MRSAMNRSASGGMALSLSDTRYQDGFVFHPAALCGFRSGRPMTAAAGSRNIVSAVSTGRVGTETFRGKRSLLNVEVGPLAVLRGASNAVGQDVLASSEGGNGCCTLAQPLADVKGRTPPSRPVRRHCPSRRRPG